MPASSYPPILAPPRSGRSPASLRAFVPLLHFRAWRGNTNRLTLTPLARIHLLPYGQQVPRVGHGDSPMAQEQSVLPKASDLLELASRPAQVIEHPSWTAARETALARVIAGPCLVVMLGPPGSGKTALLRNLAITIRERGWAACLLDFDDGRSDLGRVDVVLVDEADRISAARLDELSRRGQRPVVLAVLPASGERFRHYPGLTIVQLASLSADQACAFIAERLAQLGLPMACLTEAAWAGLVAHARGVPRLLTALLGLSLFVAGEAGASQVTGTHVEQAVAVRGGGAASEKIEPARTNADPAGGDVPAFLSGDRATADREGQERRRRRTQGVAALVAICLFAAAGMLLTGGRQRAVDRTVSSGFGVPRIVGTEKAVTTSAVNGPAAPNPPKEVASAPTLPAGPVIPPAPASPPAAPPEPNGAAAPPTRPPPAAVSGVAAQELPSGAVVHVVMIYPRGDQAAAQRGLDLVRMLRSDGFAVGDPFPAPPRESRRSISYYFAQDEGAAAEIGRRIGGQYGEGRLVRVPPSAGLPRPGTIEIALGD